MATKKTEPTTPPVVLNGTAIEGLNKTMTQSQAMASLATRSSGMAAFTVKAYSAFNTDTEESDIVLALQKAGDEVVAGDMGRVERMLVNQAITLDNIFNQMAQRAAKQQTFKGIEVFLRLAMKAQAQARSTAEALALLKNPQPYIRQANVTSGPQQVNNTYAGASAHTGIPTGAGNFQSEPNKLLEADHGQRLDTRAQGASGRVNQTVEAVGAVHRA